MQPFWKSRVVHLPAAMCLCLCLSACSRDLIDKTDFAKVKEGMSQQEVQDILGVPNAVKTEGSETRLNYRTSDGLQDVILKDGKVTGIGGSARLE